LLPHAAEAGRRRAGREQRQIRDITHPIIRDPDHACLPGWLGVALTSAADHAGDRSDAGRASARTAVAATEPQVILALQAVAEAGRAVGRAEAVIARQQLARAGVVPGYLRDVGFRRAVG
jgi:hypothetical protein